METLTRPSLKRFWADSLDPTSTVLRKPASEIPHPKRDTVVNAVLGPVCGAVSQGSIIIHLGTGSSTCPARVNEQLRSDSRCAQVRGGSSRLPHSTRTESQFPSDKHTPDCYFRPAKEPRSVFICQASKGRSTHFLLDPCKSVYYSYCLWELQSVIQQKHPLPATIYSSQHGKF